MNYGHQVFVFPSPHNPLLCLIINFFTYIASVTEKIIIKNTLIEDRFLLELLS